MFAAAGKNENDFTPAAEDPSNTRRNNSMNDVPQETTNLNIRIEYLQKCSEALRLENALLADHLQRLLHKEEDDDDGDRPSRYEQEKQTTIPWTQNASASSGKLNIDEKHSIAIKEIDLLTTDIEESRKTTQRNVELLQSLTEEAELRLSEVKKETFEFRRDIVVRGENPRNGKTIAEKVLKYMEDHLTAQDLYINKFLTKNYSLKLQIGKAEQQLASKQEAGEDLQHIDFHQLQIENQQFVVKLQEANSELLKLKKSSSRTHDTCAAMKKRVAKLTSECERLRSSITGTSAQLAKSASDIQKVLDEKEAARRENKRLRIQRHSSPNMPQIVDYVNHKAEQFELEKQKRNWQRKVEIARIGATKVRVQLAQSQTELAAMGIAPLQLRI